LIVYAEHITPRVIYIFRQFFALAGLDEPEITGNLKLFLEDNRNKLSYCTEPVHNGMNITPSGLLFENKIRKIMPEAEKWKDSYCFFRTSSEGDFPFDIFSAAFFLLSRYEEYLPFDPDEHGRYTASQSWMGENKLLHLPLVDQWAKMFTEIIRKNFPAEIIKEKKFNYRITIDVDNAWAYLHKGFLRTTAAGLRTAINGNKDEKLLRKKVLKGIEKDPYDTYDFILENKGPAELTFFFLFGKYSKFDKNIPTTQPAFRKLIRRLSEKAEIGLHPAYFSLNNTQKILREKDELEKVTGKKIISSRQHYLRMNLPETYRHLVKAGIKEDFSMTFSDQTGFRAGTGNPFLFYDLTEEKSLPVIIHPSAIMDATMKYYMHLQPHTAVTVSNTIINEIKKVNGSACLHWHNESLSDSGAWTGWKKVFTSQLETCRL